jgi:hypothetical protein
MNTTTSLRILRRLLAGVLCLAVVGCGTASQSASPTSSAAAPSASFGPFAPASAIGGESLPPTSAPDESQAPDIGGGTTAGDVPDNAVFLTYHQASLGFSIQYVEGWQVATQADGVGIRDKDSSEMVAVVDLPGEVAGYISSTDLPSLEGQSGFKLVKQNTIKVGATSYHHLVFHILSPADPVTGKQVPSTVDRYYVPGPAHLAIVSMSTPDGVDNVDAFRQMIESFKWS